MRRLQLTTLHEVKKHLAQGLSDRMISKTIHCSRNTVAGIRKGLITEKTILEKLNKSLSVSKKSKNK